MRTVLNQARGRTGKLSSCWKAGSSGACMLKRFTQTCAVEQLSTPFVLGSLLLSLVLNGRETNSRVTTKVLFNSRTWNCVLVPGAASNLWWPSRWSPGLQGLPPSPGHQAWEKKALGNQGGATKAKISAPWLERGKWQW